MKANGYKEFKGLRKESLRDNMSDIEVALADLGEMATKELAKEYKPQVLEQNKKIAKLGVKLYKCDPYCSFQREINERTNALVRRYIPKGESMKLKPQIYLDDICFEINSMPRKIFDYRCVYDVELDYK